MQSACLSLIIIVFFIQMWVWVLLCCTYYFNEQKTEYVFVYLNDDLAPQVQFGTSSGYVVLNDTQWYILVTFKGHIPKNEVYEVV
jgi:hypothetical protein